MMQSRAGSLALIGGVAALDFANTASDRDSASPMEHLQQADDVLAWVAHAEVADADAVRRARLWIAADPRRRRDLLRRTVGLRDAIYRIGSALAHDRAPAAPDASLLREFLRRTLERAEFVLKADGGYGLGFGNGPADVALLGPVVWSALDMMAGGRFERLKQCPSCGWLFRDRSKNNSRIWCDMATCGNVAKGRRHRNRR